MNKISDPSPWSDLCLFRYLDGSWRWYIEDSEHNVIIFGGNCEGPEVGKGKFQLLQCQSDELMPKSGDSYLLATIRHFTTCIHESENGHIFIMLGVEIWEQKRKTARYTFENVYKSLQPFSTSQLLIKLSPFPINSCCGLACIIVWLFCFRCEQHQNNLVVKDREMLSGMIPPPSPPLLGPSKEIN